MNVVPTLIAAILWALAAVLFLLWIADWRAPRRRPLQIQVVAGDITTEKTDAIVNAAKSSLLGGGGVDGAIHHAGGPAILAACRQLRAGQYRHGLPAGEAVATTAGRLPAQWVIHTVGPVYNPDVDRSDVLRSCYVQALAIADAKGAQSVSFPLISAGVYGWPKEDAVRQALTALLSARTKVKTARLVLFDEESYRIAKVATGR
jgi:O-acetyl-ADP-ribose deacetylase (regulator of RNase III)